jgi:GrpB-like predicted nucleotidyltransferase (UPF0157 family)
MNLKVVPHDSRWREEFEREAALIFETLRDNVIAIHHIGSTAIPGIYAKPVIDILIEVSDISHLNDKGMESLGYEVMGEFGIPGRRYFRKDDRDGTRTHQVHTFQTGSDHLRRHLAFRDHMISDPKDALAYSDMKRKLAAEHPDDAEAYMDGKDDFIKEIDRRTGRQ